jgi:hypothetical protein
VFEGRQKFAEMGEAMEPYRKQMIAAGMTQEEINAGAMGYLRLQTRLGQSQNKTSAELAEGARKYLYEQDALTKLTGQTRKEMENTIINEKDTKKNLETSLEKLKTETPIYSKSTKNSRSIDLFMGEEPDMDGVEIFGLDQDENDEIEIDDEE